MALLPSEAAQSVTALHPRYAIAFHPEGTFTWIGVHDAFADTKPVDWTFMIIHSWVPEEGYDSASLQGPAILPDLKRRAKSFAEPFLAALESIPEGTLCWHNQLTYWVTTPWDNHNSTVTLVGDAAHPVTFHRGQGLNNTIHDVAHFAKLVGEKGLSVPKDGSDCSDRVRTRNVEERERRRDQFEREYSGDT